MEILMYPQNVAVLAIRKNKYPQKKKKIAVYLDLVFHFSFW